VGTIKKLKLTPSGQVEVSLGIEESAKQYIHKDVKAKVGTDGLIGNRIVVLYGGSQQAPVINDGDVVVTEGQLNMEDMMNTLQANNKNLLSITADFKTISERMANGQGTIGKLLKDEALANDLEATLATLKRTMTQTETVSNNIANYTARLQQKGSLSNDLVTDTVIFSKLRSSAAQIENLSKSATEIVNSLKQTTSNVNAGLTNTSTPAGVLLNDAQTAESLKAVIKNLQTSTQKLDENMEAMQHNFLFRGYFKKKEKEKL
jgi:phospholipid/cholesterol/gamma-HCH transport system substrate-binding protein